MIREKNLGQLIQNQHKFGTFIIENIKIGGLSRQEKKTMACSELATRNKGEEGTENQYVVEDHQKSSLVCV